MIRRIYYLKIHNNIKPAKHRKAALGLTLLQILRKVTKLINAGILVQNVGTQYFGIAVLSHRNIQYAVWCRRV